MTTKTMIAARTFKDAGTEREFKAGEPITGVEPGELENYRAAGLIKADGDTATTDAAPPPARKRRARAAKADA